MRDEAAAYVSVFEASEGTINNVPVEDQTCKVSAAAARTGDGQLLSITSLLPIGWCIYCRLLLKAGEERRHRSLTCIGRCPTLSEKDEGALCI